MERWKVDDLIDQLFDMGRELGFVKKSQHDYVEVVKGYVKNYIEPLSKKENNPKLLNPKFWKSKWFGEYLDYRIDSYYKGKLEASTIQKDVSAIEKMKEIQNATGFIKGLKKLRVGEAGSIKEEKGWRYKLHQEGVKVDITERKSLVVDAKTSETIVKRFKNTIPATYKHEKLLKNIIDLQRATGGRISATYNLRAKDINLENRTVRFFDKHDMIRTVFYDKKWDQFMKELKGNKTQGQRIFSMKKRNGQELNTTEATKRIHKMIDEVSKKAGLDKIQEGKKYTSHFNRRQYAQNMYDKCKIWTKEDIKKEIAKYISNQGSNKEGIIKRLQNEKYRINWYNRQKGKPSRDFTQEECRRLIVSLALGHSRLSIVHRYITVDDKKKRTPKK
ncbi:tyrosine-type recombinase/integrase [Mesobacillus subterraneus]|uniref:Site-specific integrase n=1 Tax=Mesobacillus subterraneus TaxID=285983 RepID=A0A427TDL5_9BACI|nr:tyrosine-type recombinase/integrase [Mesobacillus subterraneus]RSD20626.1 site-specific integrase [Mesobacillus subterraneus]